MFKFSRQLQRSCRSFSTAVSYPYSSVAIIPPPRTMPTTDALRKGKGLMAYLQKTLPTPEKQALISTYFSKTHPNRLRPGMILTVTQAHSPTTFSGILISMRRRGPDSSFVLRNVVHRTGVELQFFVNSPHLKEIKVLKANEKKAEGQKKTKGPRLNKLFYLRDAPDKMSALSARVKPS